MDLRRSVFLLNRPFQLRFSFYVCSWLIALALAYPLIISNLFDYFIHYLAVDPAGPPLATLEKTRQDLLWLLITMHIVLISLTFLISIFMSHKIAGPLYKLVQHFHLVKAGKLDQKLSFRTTDYFQDICQEYNDMIENLRVRIENHRSGTQEMILLAEKLSASERLSGNSELMSLLERLKALHQTKTE